MVWARRAGKGQDESVDAEIAVYLQLNPARAGTLSPYQARSTG
jgi:hypothetical protein